VYWPVLLCNGRIDPEVLRVSYWKRENARCSTRKKQKPGGMDSVRTALQSAPGKTFHIHIYTERYVKLISYYRRGKDALPHVVSLLTHRHPRSLILPGSNDFGHFTHYCQGHQTQLHISTKRSVTNFTIVKKSNYIQTLFWQSLLSIH